MELKELQETFYRAIFDPSPENIAQASLYIKGTKEISSEDRLSIYRDSILGGITTGLSNIFPVCVKLVGMKYFTHMVAGYLKQYPSASADLGDYGQYLPAYIADFPPAKELIYLSDVAQLEWQWHKAFNAALNEELNEDLNEKLGHEIRSISELGEVADYALVHLVLDSSATLLRSPYPVHRIWSVNQDDFQGEPSISLDEGAVELVIWRKTDFGMQIDALSEDEYMFLSAVMNKKSLVEISELSLNQAVELVFQRCIQAGLIIGFKLEH